MARPQVADGGDGLKIWRAAANILNKQSRTGDKGSSSSLGVVRGANKSSPEKNKLLTSSFLWKPNLIISFSFFSLK
jgi:hypothetical protein